MKIIDAKEFNKEMITKVGEFYKDKEATVVIINASDDEASEVYVDKKQKAFEAVGVNCIVYDLDEYTTTEDLIEQIEEFNQDDRITGIMVQHPVYPHIDFAEAMASITPYKDIDGLAPANQGAKNYNKDIGVYPATSLGVMHLILNNNIKVAGKMVVVVGRGFLVADTLAKWLEHENATVVKIHTKTTTGDRLDLLEMADIIISCAGRKLDWLTPEYCPNAEVLIGVGFRYEEGKQYQDFDMEDWENEDVIVTNRINGTGLATVTALLINSVICYELSKGGK